jgi:beta-lactamase superfamily II metal-dependent hydrolase
LAKLLQMPINPELEKLVLMEYVPISIKFKDITFHILGPTKKSFDKLRDEWRDWLNKKKIIQDVELQLLQILNKNIPSLSSIMFVVECDSNKIPFTGVGLGKDVIDALLKNGMLDKKHQLHIDILKVPRHGIDRNVTMKFVNPGVP